MRTLFDILGVAKEGVLARKVRTALVLLGPALGVAALVGVLGLSDSAKGDVRRSLRALGTDLLVADAPIAQQGDDGFAAGALGRVAGIRTVESSAEVSVLDDIKIRGSYESVDSVSLADTFTVRAASPGFAETLGVNMAHGRFVNPADERLGATAVALGSAAAEFFVVTGGTPRTLLVAGESFAVVGVLEESRLLPEMNTSLFITHAAANSLQLRASSRQIYVRTTDGTTEETAAILPVAITYGGPGSPIVRVPTDLLEARAQVDSAFRAIVLALGGLSLLVGGIGIANVMTISVLQRSSEIGIRRALGHTRAIIAWQFLLEALFIGVAGALLGALAGVAFVVVAADYQGWVLELSALPIIGAGLLAVAVSVLAGIYPAIRAARMEPLEALRLG